MPPERKAGTQALLTRVFQGAVEAIKTLFESQLNQPTSLWRQPRAREMGYFFAGFAFFSFGGQRGQ